MKRLFIFILPALFILMSLNLYPQIKKEKAKEQFEEENIAIYAFTGNSNKFKKEGDLVTELITDVFVNMKRFNIVDRKNLDKYLKEMELQLGGLTENNVVEIGKIYGYNKAVFGSVIDASTYAGYSDNSVNVTANIEIVLKIVDVSTTKILYSSRIKGRGSENASGGVIQAQNLAMQEAYSDLTSNIQSQIRNLFKIRLTIYDRQGSDVMLLTGTDQGVGKGFLFRVYGKGLPIKTSSGEIVAENLKYKGSVRVSSPGEEYSIAKIQRGASIAKGDIAEEYIINNFVLGLYGTFARYEMNAHKGALTISDYKNTKDGSDMTINADIKKIDYAFTLHGKVGYDFGIFIPFFSAGVNFGDFFQKYYGFDFRLATDIKIPIYYDIVSFVFTPYFGVLYNNVGVGTIGGSEGSYRISDITVSSGSKVNMSEVTLGFGALAGVRVGITDTVSFNAMAGYRYFFKPVYRNLYVNSSDNPKIKNIPNTLKTLNLTGLECLLSVNFLI